MFKLSYVTICLFSPIALLVAGLHIVESSQAKLVVVAAFLALTALIALRIYDNPRSLNPRLIVTAAALLVLGACLYNSNYQAAFFIVAGHGFWLMMLGRAERTIGVNP